MKISAPLSKVQYGLYVECVAHQGEACYNIPYLYTFDGSLDEVRLCKAIEAAVAIHPTLFTRIELNEQGDPLQAIDSLEFSIECIETSDIEKDLFSNKEAGQCQKQKQPTTAMQICGR